jgi:hypothetical protein
MSPLFQKHAGRLTGDGFGDAALIAGHVDGYLPGLTSLGNNDAVVIPTNPASLDDSIYRPGFE